MGDEPLSEIALEVLDQLPEDGDETEMSQSYIEMLVRWGLNEE